MTLRVTLEIVPFGDEDRKYKIGQLDIFNMGTATSTDDWILGGHHEYGVIQIDPEKNTGGLYSKTVFHRRWHGPWALVETVLSELVNQPDDPQ